MSTIGDRIKNARENKGITQTELGDKIGSTKQTVYKYENNIVTNIPLDKIESIASELNVSPAFIMGWDDRDTYREAVEVVNRMGRNDLEKLLKYVNGILNPPRKDMITWLNNNIRYASSSGQNYEMMTDDELRGFYEEIRKEMGND